MAIAYLYLLVFVGGGLGSALRLGVNRTALALIGPNWPAGTFAVNAIGCLVMGLCAGWFAMRGEQASQEMRLFLTTGVLGGFTTFSAFSLDVALLWQRGEPAGAILYAALTLLVTIVGVFAGLAIMRAALA